jgi:hypothetical protein
VSGHLGTDVVGEATREVACGKRRRARCALRRSRASAGAYQQERQYQRIEARTATSNGAALARGAIRSDVHQLR